MAKKCLLLAFALMAALIYAQDFGFGDVDGGSTNTESAVGGLSSFSSPVTIGGEVTAELMAYPHDFTKGIEETRFADVLSAKLNIEASGNMAEAHLNLELGQDTASPISIDEAYVRAFFGKFDIEGGLRKIAWGKADSMGPLDVVNPLDMSDLSRLDLDNAAAMKIARPLIHATLGITSFSKLEAVFVPTFQGMDLTAKNRWTPALPFTPTEPDTSTLNYFQTGLRFTTTFRAVDLGVQYYYGRMTRPAMSMQFSGSSPSGISIDYNPYHQAGIDLAAVVFGFNIRAELAANLTEDFDGDDGSVYNPALAWSFGFDRELFWGINLNLQCNESITLLHDKIADNPMLDIEADADITSTRITARLSKMFLRDELEISVAGMWGVEDADFLILPSISWSKESVKLSLVGGIFCGDEAGQFGQFWKNSFVKMGVTYTF
jgi:hypothetical protein